MASARRYALQIGSSTFLLLSVDQSIDLCCPCRTGHCMISQATDRLARCADQSSYPQLVSLILEELVE